jgi:5-formyltetrahydrofolate cyclo-ligase
MQKEFEKQEKLKNLDDEHKQQMLQDIEDKEKKHKQHEPVSAVYVVLNIQENLMFLPCIIRRIRRNQQYALIVPLLYSTCWLLHVSAVACHHQGAYWILLSYVKYKRRGGISKICNR